MQVFMQDRNIRIQKRTKWEYWYSPWFRGWWIHSNPGEQGWS